MDVRSTIGSPMANAGVSAVYTGTAASTAALPAATKVVRILCTSDAFVEIGNGAVATVASMFMTAGVAEYFACQGGDRVSAIQVAAGGTVYAMPFG